MKFQRFLLLVFVMVTSCKPFSHDHYNNERLSFNISEEFFIRRPIRLKHNDATDVKVVHKDLKQFATITVSWIAGENDLDKVLQGAKSLLIESYSNPKSDAAFGLPQDGEFGIYKTRHMNYFVNNDPRKGSYHAFHCNGITVLVGEHYFEESKASLKRCLKVIEESIECR